MTIEELEAFETAYWEKNNTKKAKKRYFTEITENAILSYNATENEIDRNKIYNKFIRKSFDKLAENLIHTFKFYNFDVPYEDVKNETIAFLNEKIHKYSDPSKGKAFSYFSIVGKNYLIYHNSNNYDKFKNKTDIEAIDEARQIINEVTRAADVEEKSEFMDVFVKYIDDNLNVLFRTQVDMAVADSVLELFRNRENIENFNKKALYIMIRDRTGVKTQYITKVVNILKKMYAEMYYQFLQTGRIKYTIPKKSEFMV
jgi:hypothetical protein